MLTLKLIDVNSFKRELALKGYTIRAFAKKSNVSPAYLSQIINGHNNVSPTVAKKISLGLGKEITEIFLVNEFDEHTKII